MEFLKEIFKFFIDKEHSFTSKFIGILLVITALFVIDNILGFSFYYSSNQKVTQLETIESLKKDCPNNIDLLKILNETESKIINRKNVFEEFVNLFSKEKFDVKNELQLSIIDTVYVVKYDTIYIHTKSSNQLWLPIFKDSLLSEIYFRKGATSDSISTSKILENNIADSLHKSFESFNIKENEEHEIKSRSRLWHTLTSSYFLIFLMIILPVFPFTEKPFNWNLLIGVLFFAILCAGLIWLNQYILGLIPLIFNKPWINYILNILIHTIFWVWIGFKANKKNAT